MTQETGFNSLLTEAKRKGYLIHEDLMRLLDNDLTDSDEMERIINRLADFGIKVYPRTPDGDELILNTTDQTEAEEMSDAIEILTSETRTTDPVRMYMREMGTVELLTREGEIIIAKRIESGTRQVMSSLAQYPPIIDSLIEEYDQIPPEENRAFDLVNGFFVSPEEQMRDKAQAPVATDSSENKSKAEEKDNKGESTDGVEAKKDDEFENGPCPVYTAEQIEKLRTLQNKFANYSKNMVVVMPKHKPH